MSLAPAEELDDQTKERTLRKLWAVLIAGALVIGLLIAGCGGSGDSTNPSASGSTADAGSSGTETSANLGSTESGQGATETGAISKAAFVKKANLICKVTVGTILSEAAAVIEGKEGNPGFNQAATEAHLISTVVVPGLEAELKQLRALDTPSGEEGQVNGILDATEEVVEEAETDPKAAARRGNGLYAAANKLAEAYGLSECPYG